MTEYSIFIRPDRLQRVWQVMADGGFITDAVAVTDTSRRTGRRVLVEAGGVRPRRGRDLKGRCLSFLEREQIALGRAAGESMRSIAGRLGAQPLNDLPGARPQSRSSRRLSGHDRARPRPRL